MYLLRRINVELIEDKLEVVFWEVELVGLVRERECLLIEYFFHFEYLDSWPAVFEFGDIELGEVLFWVRCSLLYFCEGVQAVHSLPMSV